MRRLYSDNGIALTKSFESCKLTAYPDQRGIWTIGWGHRGPEIVEGLKCTQKQADSWFDQDIAWAVACVNIMVKPEINQNQFDALVDFVYNDGAKAFDTSHLLKYLNSHNFNGASEQFPLWDHAGGVVSAGLLRRRIAEQELFNKEEVNGFGENIWT